MPEQELCRCKKGVRVLNFKTNKLYDYCARCRLKHGSRKNSPNRRKPEGFRLD